MFASKAGSDRNPDWYWNLQATPDTAIEVGDETIAVRATELTGAERDEKYRTQSERFPGFAGYQQKTSSSGLRHELVALGVVEDRGVAGPERHLSLRFAGDDRKPSQASSSLP